MSASDYLLGVACLVSTLGPVAGAALVVAKKRLPDLSGSARALALWLLFIAGVMFVHLAPLLLGVLTRGTPIIAAAVVLAATRLVPAAEPAGAPTAVGEVPPSGTPAWAMALVAGGLAAVASIASVIGLAYDPFVNIDTVSFHLPNVARWIQTGSVWQVDQLLAYQAQGNYPGNGELVSLAVVLPWHNDFAVRFLNLPFMAMTAVAVYAIGVELGARRATAVLLACVMVTLPILAIDAYQNEMPDPIMYSSFAAGVAFLLLHGRTKRDSHLVLAGLGLGLSFGVKWYAVTSTAVVVVVWVVASLTGGRSRRDVGREGAGLVSLIAACGGFWWVRNLVESGNPVFPQKVSLFGVTIFDAPYDRYRHLAGFRLADYAGQPSIWRHYVWPAFNASFDVSWILLTLGIAAGGIVAARALMRARSQLRTLAAAVAAGLLAVAYTLTPYSALGGKDAPSGIGANARYAVPAMLIGAALTASLAGRLGRWRWIIELAALAAVVDGLRRAFTDFDTGQALLAAAVIAIAGAAIWAVLRVRRLSPRFTTPAAVAALVTAPVLLAAAVGYRVQHRFNDNRYVSVESPLAWVRQSQHTRVGLAGLWSVQGIYPILPAFGPRLGNTVQYVGPFIDNMLMEYQHEPRYAEALRRGRFDLVVVGRAGLPGTRRPAYERWMQAAGYREVARSAHLILYRRR